MSKVGEYASDHGRSVVWPPFQVHWNFAFRMVCWVHKKTSITMGGVVTANELTDVMLRVEGIGKDAG